MLPRATIAVVDCCTATGSATLNALSSSPMLAPLLALPAHPAAIAAPANVATIDNPEIRMVWSPGLTEPPCRPDVAHALQSAQAETRPCYSMFIEWPAGMCVDARHSVIARELKRHPRAPRFRRCATPAVHIAVRTSVMVRMPNGRFWIS
jgi:hypothetical protein